MRIRPTSTLPPGLVRLHSAHSKTPCSAMASHCWLHYSSQSFSTSCLATCWHYRCHAEILASCCRGAHATPKLCVRLTGWATLGKGVTGTATLLAIGTLGMEVSVYSTHLPVIYTARVPSILTNDYSGHDGQGTGDTAAGVLSVACIC